MRATNTVQTPWGAADSCTEIKRGIKFYSTPSHGGMHLDRDRQAIVKRTFPEFTGCAAAPWYEEDCDCCIVVLVFAEEHAADELRSAVQIVQCCARWASERGGVDRKWAPVVEWIETSAPGAMIRQRIGKWIHDNADQWERGSMGSTGPEYPSATWFVSFTRVGDGAHCSAILADYPRQRFYSAAEILAATYTGPVKDKAPKRLPVIAGNCHDFEPSDADPGL